MTTAAFDRAVSKLQAARDAGNGRKVRAWARRASRALERVSLDAYVAWINRDAQGFELMGAEAWRERGITTAPALGRLLDAEARRNQEKEDRYGDD